MKLYTYKNNTLDKTQVETIAIGVFDGVHLGHLELFRNLGTKGAVVIIYSKKENILTPLIKKERLIKHSCFFYELLEIKNLNAKEFLELLLKDFTSLKKIVIGYDFRFGNNRKYGARELKELFGGEVKVVDEYLHKGYSVHSTLIKSLLSNGKIKEANEFLGRAYSIEGKKVQGQGIGKKSLYPTINISVKEYFLPKDGVYATYILFNNKLYEAVTFLGKRVSTDDDFAIENYLLDVEDIIVKDNEDIEVFFVEFVRENQKYNDLNLLKDAISKDIAKAKDILGFKRKIDER